MRVFRLCLLWKIFFKKCLSKNQILFSFCRPTDRPYFFAVLSVDQKINLVSPKTRHIIIGIISIHNDVFVAIITIKMCVVIVSFDIGMIKRLTFSLLPLPLVQLPSLLLCYWNCLGYCEYCSSKYYCYCYYCHYKLISTAAFVL